MDLKLAGKTVVVTGGSGNIGRGLVLEFAREGANVISADRDPGDALLAEAERQGLKGAVLPVTTDVTERASLDAMVAVANERFGPVDVLVNNAGGAKRIANAAFEDYDEAARRWENALNIDGLVSATQAVAKDMLSRRTGSIVNISSNAALLGEAAYNMVNYGSVKGFMLSFTKGLAWEWAKKGVRVNVICPGWIVPHKKEHVGGETSLWNRFLFDAVGDPDALQEAVESGALFNMGNIPIPRLGRPEDIAHLALFLASDVSGYITGQRISVSGGAYMP
jgi:NAD(P)-dependent dehydrogenase (short-subunit alcohol dehydrogenase family)